MLELHLLDLTVLEAINRNNELALLSATKEFSHSIVKTREKITSMLIHDIRNPLTTIKSSVELIDKIPNDSVLRKKFIQTATSQIDRINKMTAQILESIRIEAGHILELDFQRTDLKEKLSITFNSIQMTYPDRINLEIEKAPMNGIFGIEGMARLFENLTDNAIKYGDPNRKITLRLKAEGEEVVAEVHNWGEPIPQQKREVIFLAFKRSDHTKKYSTLGWGIGLAFVQAVVEAHQGTIELESDQDDGTTFRIRIPKTHPVREKLLAA